MGSYKDLLHSSFMNRNQRLFEPEVNNYIRKNKLFIKGYCFLKIIFFIGIEEEFKLNLDLSCILYKLDFYLKENYLDYYIIGQSFVRHKKCIPLIMDRTGTKLQEILKKAIISDQITGFGIYNENIFNKITSIHFDKKRVSTDSSNAENTMNFRAKKALIR